LEKHSSLHSSRRSVVILARDDRDYQSATLFALIKSCVPIWVKVEMVFHGMHEVKL
jgi:hypothetical protein